MIAVLSFRMFWVALQVPPSPAERGAAGLGYGCCFELYLSGGPIASIVIGLAIYTRLSWDRWFKLANEAAARRCPTPRRTPVTALLCESCSKAISWRYNKDETGSLMTISLIVRKLHAPAVAVALFALPLAPAAAETLFSNPTTFDGIGSCVFNTACGNVWAAQEFSLADNATITAASYTVIGGYTSFTVKLPTAVNWALLLANGPGGLPGSVVAHGSNDPIGSSQRLTDLATLPPYFQQTFNLPSVSLAAGNYYVAFQALNSEYDVYLSDGVLRSGSAGLWGSEWIASYETVPSVAVNVYGTTGSNVPEPATFGLLVVGFAGICGCAMVRRGRSTLPYATA